MSSPHMAEHCWHSGLPANPHLMLASGLCGIQSRQPEEASCPFPRSLIWEVSGTFGGGHRFPYFTWVHLLTPAFPSSFRMVLRIWLCDSQLHKYLAVPDRGSTRVPDDASKRPNVSVQVAGTWEVCLAAGIVGRWGSWFCQGASSQAETRGQGRQGAEFISC